MNDIQSAPVGTNTPTGDQTVAVTQADRVAGNRLARLIASLTGVALLGEEVELAFNNAFARHRLSTQTLPVMGEDAQEVLEGLAKFVDDFLAPWGSWKTLWWETEVSDDAAFTAENALKHLANRARKASAALSTPVKVIETDQEGGQTRS